MKKRILYLIKMVTKNFMIGVVLQCAFLSLLLADPGNAQVKSLDRISIKVEKEVWSVKEIFSKIENNTNYQFIYPDEFVSSTEEIRIDSKRSTIQDILKSVSKETGLKFRQVNNSIYVGKSEYQIQKQILPTEIAEQAVTVTGRIISGDDDEGLPGVNVIIKGTTQGTVTDMNGRYSIDVPSTETILQFSSVGHLTEEVAVGNRSVIDVVLMTDITSLDEIVIVGYGTQKKEAVTGSISSVGTKELLQAPVANVSNALAGRMPGLIAVQQSGEPGNDVSSIRIRGVGTFGANQEPLIMVDGIEQLNWNNIDPNEIESVTILKDASATAVYGVRGANGVVLITTKRGKVGAPQISYTGNFAVNSFTDMRQQMNGYDYARTFNMAQQNDALAQGATITPRFSQDVLDKYRDGSDPILYPSSDWIDLIYKDYSTQTQHNINMSGGTERVKYFVSAGYLSQEGLFKSPPIDIGFDPNQVFKRYNFRANTDFSITNRLSLAINVDAQIEARRGIIGTGSGADADVRRSIDQVQRANPISSPGYVNGQLINRPDVPGVNPYQQMYGQGHMRDNRDYLNGKIQLDYDLGFILPGLTTHGALSYQNYNQHEVLFRRNLRRYNAFERTFIDENDEEQTVPVVLLDNVQNAFGHQENIRRNRRTYSELGLNYARKFGDHNVTGLLLYNQLKFHNPAFEFAIPNAYQSTVGRVTYDYRSKYLVAFDMGYNGTENFAEGRRFGFFPAVSAAYVLSEESFFPQTETINFLKFKFSYGEVGNDRHRNITDAGSRFLYRPSAYNYLDLNAQNRDGNDLYHFGPVATGYQRMLLSREGTLGNPILTWERARKTNVGIEMNMFRNKVNVNVEYFNENRDDILANLQTNPNIAGANLPAFNIGQMNNRGIEGSISYYSHTESTRRFSWWVSANYTYATNTVLFRDEVQQEYDYQMQTGQRFRQPFGYIAEGYYESWEEVNDPNRPISAHQAVLQPGDLKYKDVNGDGVIDFRDRVPIGYPDFPEIMYGISFGASFNGFDFSMLLQGAGNVSYTFRDSQIRGYTNNYGAPEYLLESWSFERREQGQPINFPRLAIDGAPHNYEASTFWTRDASYLRIKNVEIGYNFDTAPLKRLGVRGLRVYSNANNLFTWSNMLPGVDPETITTQQNFAVYPVALTVNLGVNITF